MSSLICPQCHSVAVAGQRFCAQCGATLDSGNATATARPPEDLAPTSLSQGSAPPPPPPNNSGPYAQVSTPYSGPQNFTPYAQPQSGSAPSYQPGQFQPAPPIAQKDSSKSVLGQIGCGFFVVLLVILALCGGLGYWGYTALNGWWKDNTTGSNYTSTTKTGSSGSGNNSQATTQANDTVKTTTFATKAPQFSYAGALVTINSVKQAAKFSDDTYTSSGILRLELKIQNDQSNTAYLNDAFLLVLPDSTTVQASQSKESLILNGGVTQLNWVDFQVATGVDVGKLVLRVGKSDEHQMDIPLVDNPDLGKYATQKINPQVKADYADLQWTITEAEKVLSVNGQQAKKGNAFVVVHLNVDNKTSDTFIGYYGTYMRLRSAETTVPPDTTTDFPTSISSGQTNVKGTCIFEVPENSTDFTLVLLKQSGGATSDAMLSFKF